MSDKYQCHICMQVAQKPVVTPCGHLFCWSCIYHWLRSNQQYLTCPICKSGIQMSSLRPLLTPHDPPQKFQNGIPPRPKSFIKPKPGNYKVKPLPKSIARIGMNLQRGVLLAGYGLFPCLFFTNLSHFKQPETEINPFGEAFPESKYFKLFKKLNYFMLIFLIIVFLII